jgi:DnaJ-class molecular chaperone
VLCARGKAFIRYWVAYELNCIFRSGAKGAAKPKKCVKCDGKGWTITQTAVSILQFATRNATNQQ